MGSSRRIAWVDYAKGIAIIGVYIAQQCPRRRHPCGGRVLHAPVFPALRLCLLNPQIFLVSSFPMEQTADIDCPGNPSSPLCRSS